MGSNSSKRNNNSYNTNKLNQAIINQDYDKVVFLYENYYKEVNLNSIYLAIEIGNRKILKFLRNKYMNMNS